MVRPSVLPREARGIDRIEHQHAEALVQRHDPPTDDPRLALLDHRTSVLCRDAPRVQLAWEISPGVHHLLEAVSFRAAP